MKKIDNLRCFIDLHLHLDGSISIQSARCLANEAGIILPESDEELESMLKVSDGCKDLNEYLEKFSLPVSLMQTEKCLEMSIYNLCTELDEKGYIYAEIRFAPQKHCMKGLTQDEVVRAVLRGLEKSDFDANLILCCMRDGADNREENIETVNLAKKYLGKGVCACDLAGAEALFPNENYMYVFEEAIKLNVPFTVHSGEALGSESVLKAINAGAYRIGHGVRSIEDENVVKLLAEKHIPLEICPTSNINTCVYDDIESIPIKQLTEYGIIITINSDNMSVSDTDVKNEFLKLLNTFKYEYEDIEKFILNSIDAAFIDNNHKEILRKSVIDLFVK